MALGCELGWLTLLLGLTLGILIHLEITDLLLEGFWEAPEVMATNFFIFLLLEKRSALPSPLPALCKSPDFFSPMEKPIILLLSPSRGRNSVAAQECGIAANFPKFCRLAL